MFVSHLSSFLFYVSSLPQYNCVSVRSPLEYANSLPHHYLGRFSPTPMNHGDSVALTSVVVIVPGSFLSRERLHVHSPSSPFFLPPFVACSWHEIRLQNKNRASDTGSHHRRCNRLLLRLTGHNRFLHPEPDHQCHLHDCSCRHCVFGIGIAFRFAPC